MKFSSWLLSVGQRSLGHFASLSGPPDMLMPLVVAIVTA